ncbi:hypothetical protein [Nocardia asteroides]|uniref:hypothetical protein n=1 Tax=Nocardia asteroides TaxID=1824 RepID=UPI001E3BCAE2|nr:hypothetical protein [Nocardia asteroides]UGT58855.1 hypothetical protein LTT85_33425 [Nocardia asteroides]
MNNTISAEHNARCRRGGHGLRRRTAALRTRLASWRAHRDTPAQLELTVAEQRWLSVDVGISTIDGAALVQIDTIALDPARRCRVYVNDGPVYDAVPDEADHDTDHLAAYLDELRRQELINLTRASAAARAQRPDLPQWPYENADPADTGRDWPLITLDQIVRWGGTALTEDEIDRLVAAIPKSSIPDAIADIVAAITADPGAGELEQLDADPAEG